MLQLCTYGSVRGRGNHRPHHNRYKRLDPREKAAGRRPSKTKLRSESEALEPVNDSELRAR